MNAPTPEVNDEFQKRRASIIATIFLVAILANLALSLSQGIQNGEWQQFARAGVVLIFGATTTFALIRIRRGQIEFGIHLILIGMLTTLLGTASLLAEFGLALALLEVLLTFVVASQTLPQRKSWRMIFIAIVTALATFGTDFLPLNYRTPAPLVLVNSIPIIAGLVILVFMILVIWQASGGKSLHNKILIPTITITIAVLSGVVAIVAIQTNRSILARENERMMNLQQVFINRLDLLVDFSVALATETAENPEVQEAFSAKDRERLIELTQPGYIALDEAYDIPQYQFHLPPATSFLRLHQLDQYGDDLSSFRFTVLAANVEKRPIGGLEIGRGGLGVRGIVPVRHLGDHIGTVEFGLNVDQTLLNDLKNTYKSEWQILLLKGPAEIATFVTQPTSSVPPHPDLLFQASTLETPIFSTEEGYTRALQGEINIESVSVKGNRYAVLSTPVYDFSRNIIGVVNIISDQAAIVQQQRQQITNLILILIITMLFLGTLIYFLVSSALNPIRTLTESARAIAAGNLNQKVTVSSQDELGILAQSFNLMTSELMASFTSLEERVTSRTKDLATVAEVGTITSSIMDTNRLLHEVVELTKERFHLYHSHIYLLDEKGENLVLTAGAGEPGRIMAAEKRSIPLNREQSLVARAARERKGVTVNDVTLTPDFLPNPLLPNTRSELAVPMIFGTTLLGVFDIQSDQVGRFTDSDINIQTTLAAQVATSIQNVRSFQQSREQADLETLVNTIGQKIQRATTVEDTLQTAIRELGLALGATRVEASITSRQGSSGDFNNN